MIYTVIARTDILTKYYEKKWDCSTEQPLNLIKIQEENDGFDISPDVRKYISDTKNEKTKKERMSAYTSLFFSLYKLFNVRPSEILRTEYSKPYIRENVYFSISHAGELTAVSVSSDTEVGVDIQERISEKIGEKVDKRFLNGFEYNEGHIDINYFYLSLDEYEDLLLHPLLDKENKFLENINIHFYNELPHNLPFILETEYTKKWTAAEAVSKLFGRGLGYFSKLPENTKYTICSFKTILIGDKLFYIANAIEKIAKM